jgi:hypothetical protein
MISYKEAVVKKLSEFHTFCYPLCLETETSPKKFHRLIKEAARFVRKVTFKLKFEFKIFYTLHIQHVELHVKIWYIFVFIYI